MSMVLVMRRVDEAQVAAMLTNSDLIAPFVLEDEPPAAPGDLMYFDKAWHAVHFLFTGQAGYCDKPLSFLRNDSEEIGDDLGYGPARVISAARMRDFHDSLVLLSDAKLKARYDPAAFEHADIYSADIFVDEGEDGWDYIAQCLPPLRKFADTCVATKAGAIVAIC